VQRMCAEESKAHLNTFSHQQRIKKIEIEVFYHAVFPIAFSLASGEECQCGSVMPGSFGQVLTASA